MVTYNNFNIHLKPLELILNFEIIPKKESKRVKKFYKITPYLAKIYLWLFMENKKP